LAGDGIGTHVADQSAVVVAKLKEELDRDREMLKKDLVEGLKKRSEAIEIHIDHANLKSQAQREQVLLQMGEVEQARIALLERKNWKEEIEIEERK